MDSTPRSVKSLWKVCGVTEFAANTDQVHRYTYYLLLNLAHLSSLCPKSREENDSFFALTPNH